MKLPRQAAPTTVDPVYECVVQRRGDYAVGIVGATGKQEREAFGIPSSPYIDRRTHRCLTPLHCFELEHRDPQLRLPNYGKDQTQHEHEDADSKQHSAGRRWVDKQPDTKHRHACERPETTRH